MKCPHCGNDRDFNVLDTAHVADGVRRRRECNVCKERFTTAEVVIEDKFMGRGINRALERKYEDRVVKRFGDDIISSVRKIQQEQAIAGE